MAGAASSLDLVCLANGSSVTLVVALISSTVGADFGGAVKDGEAAFDTGVDIDGVEIAALAAAGPDALPSGSMWALPANSTLGTDRCRWLSKQCCLHCFLCESFG